jgi:hypothetical protein
MKVKECPSSEEIWKACEVYGDWLLHYYQLLYFQAPKLTEPGRPAVPFYVAYDPEHMACLRLVCHRNPEYSFIIRSLLPKDMTQKDVDADVLRKCRLILETVRAEKQKIDQRVCCGLAVATACVCAYSWACELHGGQHIGSHD